MIWTFVKSNPTKMTEFGVAKYPTILIALHQYNIDRRKAKNFKLSFNDDLG